jgi:hypothetical protein
MPKMIQVASDTYINAEDVRKFVPSNNDQYLKVFYTNGNMEDFTSGQPLVPAAIAALKALV